MIKISQFKIVFLINFLNWEKYLLSVFFLECLGGDDFYQSGKTLHKTFLRGFFLFLGGFYNFWGVINTFNEIRNI